MNRISCLLHPVSCFLLALLVIIRAAACWVVCAQHCWPHNHIVSCSPPKETPKTPHHVWGLLSQIFGQGSWKAGRSVGSRNLEMIRQRETFWIKVELLCLNFVCFKTVVLASNLRHFKAKSSRRFINHWKECFVWHFKYVLSFYLRGKLCLSISLTAVTESMLHVKH